MRHLIILALLAVPSLAGSCSGSNTCKTCLANRCSWCTASQSCVATTGLECVFGNKINDLTECPVQIKEGYEYDESFTRDIMLRISGAAYSGNPQKCLTNAVHGAKLIRQVTVRCDAADEDLCSGFTALSTYHKAIIISFRGTSGFIQLVMEGAQSVFDSKESVSGGGTASKYFYGAFAAIWNNGMMEDVLSLRQQNPDYELWVTGHSLGGAMASIAAHTIVGSKIIPGELVKLVTFGQPRTGDRDFSKAHDELLPYTYRVTHKLDLVPHLPTEGYADYYHHRYEVWYDNDMTQPDTYKLCLSPEDGECSAKNVIALSVEDHLHYFNSDVSGLGGSGCV